MSRLTRKQAEMLRDIVRQMGLTADDNYTAVNPFVLDEWITGKQYQIGDRCQYEGKPYKVVQSHTSQEDWTPDLTPALFVEISYDEWPEWKQPTGTQDAYNKGDKVSYEGNHYISLIDGNVWSPTAYPAGWEKQA